MSKPHFMVTECSLWEPQGESFWEGPWGSVQQPSQPEGLGWATGVWGRPHAAPEALPCHTRAISGCLSLDSAGLTLSHAENTGRAGPPGRPGITPRCLRNSVSPFKMHSPQMPRPASVQGHFHAVPLGGTLPFEDLMAGHCGQALMPGRLAAPVHLPRPVWHGGPQRTARRWLQRHWRLLRVAPQAPRPRIPGCRAACFLRDRVPP